MIATTIIAIGPIIAKTRAVIPIPMASAELCTYYID